MRLEYTLRPIQADCANFSHRRSADMFVSMDGDLEALLYRQIAELEARIEQSIVSDDELASTVEILGPVPDIGQVTSTMLIAAMPELGHLSGEQAAALTGLGPIALDSGALGGKRAIGGVKRLLRHVLFLFQAALVASHHNPVLNSSRIACARLESP